MDEDSFSFLYLQSDLVCPPKLATINLKQKSGDLTAPIAMTELKLASMLELRPGNVY